MKKLYGVSIPIVTPFTPAGEVDLEGLKSLVDFLIEKGVHCLYPAGSTGEMLNMSVEERKLLAETVVNQTAGRVPVFVQVGAMNQKDTLELAKHAVSIGADGIAVVTPSYFKLTDDELLEYYKTVSSSVPADYPIYMYGIPQCSVNDISAELANRVAEACPNIIGLKYSFNDAIRMNKFMAIRDGEFSFLGGCDDLFTMILAMGADGIISGNAQIIPEHYVAIWDAVQAGDFKKAAAIQHRTNVLNAILSVNRPMARIKAVLKYRGILADAEVRAPQLKLNEDEYNTMLAALNELDFTNVLV